MKEPRGKRAFTFHASFSPQCLTPPKPFPPLRLIPIGKVNAIYINPPAEDKVRSGLKKEPDGAARKFVLRLRELVYFRFPNDIKKMFQEIPEDSEKYNEMKKRSLMPAAPKLVLSDVRGPMDATKSRFDVIIARARAAGGNC